MTELHLELEIRKGNENKPVGIKLVFGCVLLGGNNNERYSLNSNRICVCESNIHDSLKQFWQIESYGTSKENPEILLPKSEQRAIEILNKPFVKKNRDITQLDFCGKKKILNYVTRLKSVENKFKRGPEFCKKCQQTIESYLKNGYAKKLNTKLYTENNEIVNYIPHYGIKNVDKPGKNSRRF